MPAAVPCPQCGKTLNLPDALLNQSGRCPSCDHVFVLADASIQREPMIPTPFTAMPPSTGLVQPPDHFSTATGNEFAHFHSGGRAVYTPPRTFHLLFRWMSIATALQILAGASLFALVLVVDPGPSTPPFGPSGPTTPGGYLDVGWKTIYFRNLSDDEAAALLTAFALLVLATLAQSVLFFVLLYKCWALIQDGYPQTTPGRAVGFWFIPVFNLYWIFVAVRGLADDLNRYAMRRKLPIRKVSISLATVYYAVKLCSMFPIRFGTMNSFLGYAALPALLLELIVMYQIKNAAAGIASAQDRRKPFLVSAGNPFAAGGDDL